MRAQATTYLRQALDQPNVDFRDGQWEAIDGLLNRRRLLVVQRTGWGKSMVYFLATRLLRDQGAGVTLLISPLLSLMRNQIEAARRIGVRAETINSTNTEDWDEIEDRLQNDQIDILLISPERLANDNFRANVLAHVADRVGLFVVDEAHCISDWGHDFRPDYRRIVRVLQAFPSNIPVLATTATANDRVVADVLSQLGEGIQLVRGPLVRESLKLQNIVLPSPAARMAWLARTLPALPGSGIIYTLTVRDAERVSAWLKKNDISAEAYHADVKDVEGEDPRREVLEQDLLQNEVKVLVSTVALGMGFDKPDLGFVIHFQRPGSVVHYYQQVGRAGRAVEEAYGILLHGEEDERITDYFIRNAFPPQQHVEAILEALGQTDGGLSVPQLKAVLNLSHGQIEKALKFLSVESPAPVTKIGSKWNVTAVAETYRINEGYVDSITAIRHQEQAQMTEYMEHRGCLMEFLARALDDPAASPCGRCAGCVEAPLLSPEYNLDLANQAAIFLKRSYQPLKPRKQWPSGGALPIHKFSGRITADLCAEEGRALCLWRDAGWGQMVAAGKYEQNHFDDSLVTACVEMLREWTPDPAPTWLTCIPSLNHPDLVPDFARRLAECLCLPFRPCLSKTMDNPQQKHMNNSFQQARNLDGAFGVDVDQLMSDPCLLVDDMTDSGWTFTVAAALLRQAGCPVVHPLALTLNSPRMD
ncbi:MAG: RecQ family ATP-dependent DNA helicase [Verrucomicrobia bacterium]|nr:RecQ family ATP-dependent DNA helicase [Verrucomicrobiota bacterium]MCH8512259.1 RecQ family ATP-dependent DNA helicase [Kiritimatiellia bacterium]